MSALRIGVFGKGRLGSVIAAACGPRLAWAVGRESIPDVRVDVAIDASSGAAVPERLDWALTTKTPLVIGATGWSIPDLAARVGQHIGVVVAPNFSLSVALLARLSGILGRFAALAPERDPYLIEHHHAGKHDAPSGTARLLAQQLIDNCPRKTSWDFAPRSHPLDRAVLSVASIRAGATYSEHRVGIDSPGEVLELRHEARNATPFADGAIAAADWIVSRRGVFTFADVARDVLDPLFGEDR